MNLRHQLQERRRGLAQLYIIWDKVFSTLQEVEPGGSWGPTDAIELARARQEVEKDEVDHGGDEYEVSSDEDEQ